MTGPSKTLLIGLSFLGGSAALLHQLLWVRRLVDVVGATADTFASVVGAFFLGLALGGWLASKSQALRLPAWLGGVVIAEIAIAVLSLGVLFSPLLADWVQSLSVPATPLRWTMALLLIMPPAVFMGVTTPWLIAAANTRGDRIAVPIYAANTLGAVLGVGVGLLLLLPNLGTIATGLTAASLNALIALTLLATGARGFPTFTQKASTAKPSTTLPPLWIGLSFFSGLIVLLSEVVVQLQFTQIAINSLFASGFVLALVLLALAAGAFAAPVVCRRASGEAHASLRLASLVALCGFAVQPALFWVGFRSLDYLPYQIGAIAYLSQLVPPALLCVFVPFFFMGLLFPVLLRGVESTGIPPSSFGRLLAWNGLGGWLGAEITQGFLLPKFGLWGTAPLVACALALALIVFSSRERREVFAFLVLGLSVGIWILFSNRPHVAPSPEDAVRALRIGREGIVTVVSHKKKPDDWRIIFNNSYTLGGSCAAANQERQAHLPILLHGNARHVATLGLATGSTASGAIIHPSVESVDAIELSPLVVDSARNYFGPYNRGFFDHPKANVIQADARWAISKSSAGYDVIIGDLFLPWRTGEGRLFTKEHFQNVRQALAPGGLYCQWLPMYQLTAAQYDSIVRTFLEVFPEAFLIRGDFYAAQPILGLVGGRSLDSIDWSEVEAACRAVRSETRDAIARHGEGVAMMVVGPLRPPDIAKPGTKITLNNGWLEWDGGRNLLKGGEPWFAAVPMAEYLRERHKEGRAFLPHRLQLAHEAGQFFLTLAVAHEGNVNKDALLARLPAYLPAAMRSDTDIYWPVWPSNFKPGVHVTWEKAETP